MGGRWPVFGLVTVLLDMDTKFLDDPSAFYQAWTRRLMNDKTDTLDAIARERARLVCQAYARNSGNDFKEHFDTVAAVQWMQAALAEADAALSNQGEGAVRWQWRCCSLGSGSHVWRDCEETEFDSRSLNNGLRRDDIEWRALYLHPAEADRRDAERYRFLRDADTYPVTCGFKFDLETDELMRQAATQEQT